MGAIQKLKSYVTGSNSVEMTTYRCTDCGNRFDSAKSERRARCTECLCAEVEPDD